jgi:hypothetical protein
MQLMPIDRGNATAARFNMACRERSHAARAQSAPQSNKWSDDERGEDVTISQTHEGM